MLVRVFITLILLITAPVAVLAQDTKSTIVNASSNKAQVIGETYAIIVGVSEYKNLQSLLYASKDAETFKLLLKKVANVPDDHIRIYLDSATTKADITYTWSQWLRKRKLKRGDRIFFYLSGHGDAYNKTQFFFTHEADLASGPDKYDAEGNVNLTILKQKLIREYVDEYGVEVIFIVDACRTREKETSDSLKNMQQRFNAANIFDKVPGFITLYATKDGSVAYESSKFGGGHGLFTFYFIKGAMGEADLNPKDGVITLHEIFRYIEDSVRQKARETFKAEQRPVFFSMEDDEKQLFTVETSTAADTYKDYAIQASLDQKLEAYVTKRASIRIFKGKSDSLLLDTYNKFTRSLKDKQLIGANSALMYFNALKKIWSNDAITEEAELMLITELINYSQTYVHLYLLGLDMNYIQTKASSNDPNALFYQDLSLISSSNFVLAAQCLETAIELMGKTDNSTRSLYPKLWFLQARSYFDNPKEINLATAIQLAEKALRIDTGAVHLYHLLAMLEVQRNNLSKAEYYFNKAIEGQSEYSKEGIKLGYEFFKLKKLKEASLFYRLRTITSNQYSAAYNNIAITSDDIGDYNNAEKFFKLAIDKEPSIENSTNLSIFYQKQSEKFLTFLDYKKAELNLKLAAATGIKTHIVYYNLGNLYARKEQWSSSRNAYLKSLQINKTYTLVLENLAVLYYKNQFYDSCLFYSKLLLKCAKRGTPEFTHATRMITNSTEGKKRFSPPTSTLVNKKDSQFTPED